MGQIVFAKTRYGYGSYTDYWTLVNASNFDVCYIDEMELDNPDKLYIVSPINGELRPHLDNHPGRKAKIISWNLERPSGSGGISNYVRDGRTLVELGYVDGIWVSDKTLADVTGFGYMVMGCHPALGTPGHMCDKRYDLSLMACYSYRRSNLFVDPNSDPGKLVSQLDGLSLAQNCWGDERHDVLMKSKFMLNVHQDQYKFCEPLRFSLAAAYGLPVLTEELVDPYPYADYILQASSWIFNGRDMPLRTIFKIYGRSYLEWYEKGLEFRKYMCEEYGFRRWVEGSV